MRDALTLVHARAWDVIVIDYNLLLHDRDALELFHESSKAGIGLLAADPLAAAVSDVRMEVGQRVRNFVEQRGDDLRQTALAYALRPDAVSSVIVRAENAADMQRLAATPAMDDATADTLEDVVLGIHDHNAG